MLTPIERVLLAKLFARGAIGKNHYRIETILHMGWKSHERGAVHNAITQLLRTGYLRWYNKHKEAIQLNEERLEEIQHIIEEDLW